MLWAENGFCFRLFDAHARESTRLLLLVCCGLTYMMRSDLIQCNLPRTNMVLSTLSIYNLSIIYLQSIFLSFYLTLFLSSYLSIILFVLSLHLSISVPLNLSIQQSIYLPIYLSVYLSICLSTNLSTAWVLHKTSLYTNLRGSSPRRATYFQLYQTHSTLRIWGTLE